MQTGKRVVKNMSVLYLRMAITIVFTLITTRVVLQSLGAHDFGLFGILTGVIAMLTFLNTAMAATTQRFMSYAQGQQDEQKLKKIFNVSIVLHFFIAIVILLVLELIGIFLFRGVLNIPVDRIGVAKIIYQFIIASTVFSILSVPYDAVINARENMTWVAITGVIEALIKLVIAIYISRISSDRLLAYGFLMCSLSIFTLLLNRFYCHKRYEECRLDFRKYYDQKMFKEMAHFGGWSFLGSTAGMISNYGQGLVINVFFGTLINAAQGIANQLAGQVGSFSMIMQKALNPVIVKSEGGGNRELMIRSTMMGSKFSFLIMSFFAIPLIVEMPFVLGIWLKDVPEFAVIFCRLLLIKSLIEQLFLSLSVSIAAVGKIKKFQLSISILALLPLPISYVLFQYGYPPYFIYIVFIIQTLLRCFGLILFFSKALFDFPVGLFYRDVIIRSAMVTVITLLALYIVLQTMEPGLYRLFVSVITSCTIFLLSVKMVGLGKGEDHYVRSLLTLAVKRIPLLVRH